MEETQPGLNEIKVEAKARVGGAGGHAVWMSNGGRSALFMVKVPPF